MLVATCCRMTGVVGPAGACEMPPDGMRNPQSRSGHKFGTGGSSAIFVLGVCFTVWFLLRRLRHEPSERGYLVCQLFVLESLALFDQDRLVAPQVCPTPMTGRGIRFVVRTL